MSWRWSPPSAKRFRSSGRSSAGVTAVAIASTVSTKLAITVGVYFFMLHQLEANVLVPKIMERRVGVSPVTVIVALLIGGALWGIVGAMLAIPTAAILSVIVQELAADAAPSSAVASRGPEHVRAEQRSRRGSARDTLAPPAPTRS